MHSQIGMALQLPKLRDHFSADALKVRGGRLCERALAQIAAHGSIRHAFDDLIAAETI